MERFIEKIIIEVKKCKICHFIFMLLFTNTWRSWILVPERVHGPPTRDRLSCSWSCCLYMNKQNSYISLISLKITWGYSFSCQENQHGNKFSQERLLPTLHTCVIDRWTLAKWWLLSLFLTLGSLPSTNCTLSSFTLSNWLISIAAKGPLFCQCTISFFKL